MSVKRFLESLVVGKAQGPSPSFTVFDAVRVLELVARAGSIGRGKLAEKLTLGRGATRTLLTHLTDAGLVSSSRGGCAFTAKGEKVWNELHSLLPWKVEVEQNELTFAAHNVAVLVKDKASNVKKGLEQRDAAVRAGAKGTATLVCKDGKLLLPTVSADVASDYPEAFNAISRLMKPEDNDVIIISSADNAKEAEYGALAAAWTLI